jgi:putative FmdB family regulatory protein
MPLYEFQCEQCKHRFEKIQKFSDPDPEACPSCGAGPIRKLPSSPAIQFKGSGWYITDYAKKSSTDSGKSGGSEKGDSGSSAKPDSGSSDKPDSTKSSSDSSPASTTPAATNTKKD